MLAKKYKAELNNQCLIVWTNNLCMAQIGQATELCWNWTSEHLADLKLKTNNIWMRESLGGKAAISKIDFITMAQSYLKCLMMC